MTKRQIQISQPSTGNDEWQALQEPLATGWLTQGPKVAAFEDAFANRHQVHHALATSSCTTGLHLILEALGVGQGDEVIVPAFTWVATANVVLYCGAKPVFVDVHRDTYNLDCEAVAKSITPRTKAVIAVHLFGLCADMDGLRAVVPDSIAIVEDAACASGASYRGIPAGGLGAAAAFSFHPRKSITTGEGGMVTTNDPALADSINMLRNHGASISEEQRHNGPKPYILPDFNLLGFNYRMTDLQGAVGVVQLQKLDGFIDDRAKWAAFYRDELADVEWLRLPKEPNSGRHAWQAFTTYVDPALSPLSRNEIMEVLQDKGISTRPGTHAIHMLGYYRKLYNFSDEDFSGARDCNNQTMAIPLHNRMSAEDYEYIVAALRAIN